ncbi:hypothetical protein BDY17DRAFT_291993 [Neohortaea acidophila]|uniref:BAR domain-containing protein n=1 Tax=Neohortaea acidophila TaxID=245834 RepID=A0A6A6Q3U1_9PEZI|nr:uncharacterized protein BDY17DRAFT_291993 [Neohortaea acidophila]KAF2486721.1 hypothetical protein BDY17DRAFT_291993 [Neohortaea acidophila]
MSWKGFSKGVHRAPQQFKQKFNLGEITKDAVFMDAERRFAELETETKKLHDESSRYFKSINDMLDHQIEFAKAVEEIYKPISGRASDPNSFVDDVGNPEGIRACEEYQTLVQELKESLAPELELIQTRIVAPADELMAILKVARKWTVKRDHKQLDYDKERNKLKKLQDKSDRSAKDESALYKTENAYEDATQQYEDLNNLLKLELPQLFEYEREFIQPLFQSFYYMQLNVFYTLHEKMQAIDIGYFDFTRDIEDAFQEKRGDVQAQVEAIPVVKFKTTGQRRPPSKFQSKLALENGRTSSPTGSVPSTRRLTVGSHDTPPPYSPNGDLGRSASTGSSMVAAAKAKPPPPKPKPSRLSGAPAAETVTAIWPYEAQAEGDLTFNTGDVIEIVQRTENVNEWWVGRIGTRQGQFPGNYVELNS